MGNWIFNKHTKNIEVLDKIIVNIVGSKIVNVEEIGNSLKQEGLYKPRETFNTTTIANKFKELQFYNLLYKKEDNYLLSSYGNYYYKGIISNNMELKNDALIGSLFNIQFPHVYNKSEANLYPFRILLFLLSDERLDKKLYNDEIISILFSFDFSSENEETRKEELDVLVFKIQKFRKKDEKEKLKEISEIRNIADRIHQFDYYVSNLLFSFDLLDIDRGEFIRGKFCHPQNENSKSKPTYRKLVKIKYQITDEKMEYVSKLLCELPAYQNVKYLSKELKDDFIKMTFNQVSEEFLNKYENNNTNKNIMKYMNILTEDVLYHAKNSTSNSPYVYEGKLEELYNMFQDIDAQRISGAGQTDIECIYAKKLKFNVEAKSTKNKLISINSGRLKLHQVKSNSEYTVVLAPKFAPSAMKYDILESNICTIQIATLCEYITNQFLHENYSYEILNNIISKNLGKDITPIINSEISKTFGYSIG